MIFNSYVYRYFWRCMGLAAFFFAPGLALAEMPDENVPVFQNGTLFIPRVDTPDQLGQYQSVFFVQNADGTWGVADGLVYGARRLFARNVTRVTPIVTDTFPVQVFLKVEGGEPDCVTNTRAYARKNQDVFEVKLFHATSNDSIYMECGGYREFAEIIPLPVYGLEAGIYIYRVFAPPTPTQASTTPRSLGGSFQIPRKNSF